ncbi:MAG: diaminopimelate epimerase [Armatimonadetes bacterium]|nr:diaminopimelate epimerase [Armatimonadota bacterium]
MKSAQFWKVESIGNDFVLIHTADFAQSDLSDMAIRLCDRRFGIGSDGLLTLEQRADDSLNMRMFNPDGTEDFCGNGLRCAAQHAYEIGWFSDGVSTIHHGGKPIRFWRGVEGTITNEIGPASYHPDHVPTSGREEILRREISMHGELLRISSLTTGSTHTVVEIDAMPSDEKFGRISPILEHHPFYPDRTSVIWLVAHPEHLQIRIWERGVGETLGCGTGSSAAAAHYFRTQGHGGRIEVRNPGGSVVVEGDSWDSILRITGVAKTVFHGWLD